LANQILLRWLVLTRPLVAGFGRPLTAGIVMTKFSSVLLKGIELNLRDL